MRDPEPSENELIYGDVPSEEPFAGIVTVEQAARFLKVNTTTLYEAIKRREVPGVIHIGNAIRVSASAVIDWFGNGQGLVSRKKQGRKK